MKNHAYFANHESSPIVFNADSKKSVHKKFGCLELAPIIKTSYQLVLMKNIINVDETKFGINN